MPINVYGFWSPVAATYFRIACKLDFCFFSEPVRTADDDVVWALVCVFFPLPI